MQSAPSLTAPPSSLGDERTPHSLAPSRSAWRLDAILLGAIVVVATVVYSHYALRVGTFQLDESLYIHEARLVAAHFPDALFQSVVFPRGLQRLDQLLLALPFFAMRGPGAFEVDRVIQCLLFASAAVPAFLLARAVGLGRLPSLLAALLTAIVPWAVVSTSFLTESAAYPAFAWLLYAVWATTTKPSLPREALALLALALAVLSRTAMLALAPMLPLAVLWQELRWEMLGYGVRRRVRSLPARLWRRHPLVSAVTGAGIALYLAARLGLLPTALSTLTGVYGVPHIGAIGALLERYEYFLSRSAVGTGLVALVVGLPWLLRELVRPRDGRRHALAVVCLLGVLCMLLSLISAAPDERYTAYAAVPIALMFVTGLTSRPGLGVLAGAVAIDLLIESVTWPPMANMYDFFTYPAAVFYQRVLLGHVSLIALPLVHLSPERLVQLAVLVVALAWLLASRRTRLASPAAVVLGAGVLTLCSIQTYYALNKYVTGAGAGTSAVGLSWIDRQVPAGTHVAVVPVSLGMSLDFTPIWETAEMWNTSVDLTAFVDRPTPGAPHGVSHAPLPIGMRALSLKTDGASGLLSVIENETFRARPLRYVLMPEVTMTTVGFEVDRAQIDPSLLVSLLRLHQPARLEWGLDGTSGEGFMAPGAPARATVYSAAIARDKRCVSFQLMQPPGVTRPWPFVVLDAGRVLSRGTLTASHPTVVKAHLVVERRLGWPIARLTVRVRGDAPSPSGKKVGARVDDFAVQKCSGRA